MADSHVTRDQIEEIEAWPLGRLGEWQAGRLREVVSSARARNPFYRKLWKKSGLESAEVSSLAEIDEYPIVTKEDLIAARDQWASPAEGPVGFSTRGTSGRPLLVWLSRKEEEAYIRPTMRGFRWAGFRDGMTALLMSPVWHRLAACEAHAVARLGGRCAFFWGSMGGRYTDSFLAAMREIRPEFVTTTAPFILSVIKRARERGPDLPDLFSSVRSIVAVGLPLTPRLREFLRDRLAVDDVFERSGTQEGAALDECHMHTAPHVHEDVCYLEVVDDAGQPVRPGRRGNLIVTKLSTAGSVFVRYNTEDIAAFLPGSCPCGINFRRLKIFGRPESSVVVNGKRITAYDVRLCVEEDPALVGRNVLLIRGARDKSTMLEVAVEGRDLDEARLRRRLCDQFGIPDARVMPIGDLRLNWSMRQVIDRSELQSGPR